MTAVSPDHHDHDDFDHDGDDIDHDGDDFIGDGDDDQVFALNVTRALFDKSNSAREAREERGPEVVLVNLSANSINHHD